MAEAKLNFRLNRRMKDNVSSSYLERRREFDLEAVAVAAAAEVPFLGAECGSQTQTAS